MAAMSDCQQVDMLNSALRGTIGKKAIADTGTFQYMDPVTGDQKTATVSQEEKAAATAAYTSALAALKAYVANLA